MIPNPFHGRRPRRERTRLPDRTRPLALPNEACVVCGGPGAHAANGYYCPSCKPIHHVGQVAWLPGRRPVETVDTGGRL